MWNRKSQIQKDAESKRRETTQERNHKVYSLPDDFKQEVKEFEKDFIAFCERNRNVDQNYLLEKYLVYLGAIRVSEWEYPMNTMTILNVPIYGEAMMKWDGLQTLRRRRSYAQEKEIENMPDFSQQDLV